MKKTIAKIMAAAMLVASLPAMTMPTLTVQAEAQQASVSYVKFNGSYQTNKYFTRYLKEDATHYDYDNSDGIESSLILKEAFGMKQNGTGIWNTHIQYLNDGIKDGSSSHTTSPSSKMGAYTLKPGTASITKDETKSADYYDQTGGVVKEIKIDSNSEMIITLDMTKLTDAKKKELAAGTNNKIEFTPWDKRTGDGDHDFAPVFTIQIGEVLTVGKTTLTGASTPDGYITDASVVINKDFTATLVKVSDNDKKVLMKGQKIEVSEIEVGGVEYSVRKFDEQCLKNAKMKRLTAKQVKNIETGAVRGCKKLTRVTMGNTKIRKIHSNAFLDCEKLKNIKINCKNLKAVGSKAFKGLKKNCVISIKAKKGKYNQVVKMIKKSGTDQVKFKRV